MVTRAKPTWPPARVFVQAHHSGPKGEPTESWCSGIDVTLKDARANARVERKIFRDTEITIHEYRLVPKRKPANKAKRKAVRRD